MTGWVGGGVYTQRRSPSIPPPAPRHPLPCLALPLSTPSLPPPHLQRQQSLVAQVNALLDLAAGPVPHPQRLAVLLRHLGGVEALKGGGRHVTGVQGA